MIGGFISDDYYFCFEDEDISTLEQEGRILGYFYQPANTLNGKAEILKIEIKIHNHQTAVMLSAKLDYSVNNKVKVLHLLKDEFTKLLLKPTKSVLEYGGYGIRFGDSNVYIFQPKSERFQLNKAHIENLLNQVKSGH